MDLLTLGQIAKPIIFCSMSILSIFSVFILAYTERRD